MTLRRALQVDAPGAALRIVSSELPAPSAHEVLIAVEACGVCRTDLHVIDGDIPCRYPVVPGHEVIGRVLECGSAVESVRIGDRVGVPWLGGTCGVCDYCRTGRENLCDRAIFTGATRDGGYASHLIADARYCLPIPDRYGAIEAAPLMCAGLIGYRSLKAAGDAPRLGIFGFGAAAHIVAQVARWQGREVFAFTRRGDTAAQAFARKSGCCWAGASGETPPWPLDAALLFAPVGALVPEALRVVRKGGRVICAGIHMSDIPSFPYAALWGERTIASVANLTRADGTEFLHLAVAAGVTTSTTPFPMSRAGEAVRRLRQGRITGAAVLVPDEDWGTDRRDPDIYGGAT